MKQRMMQWAVVAMAACGVEAAAQTWSQPVRDVEAPHRAPYQANQGIGFGIDCANCATATMPALPANKRLVVEHVSMWVYAPPSGQYMCRIGPPGGPFTVLEPPKHSVSFLLFSQAVRLYLDQAPMVTCSRNESSSTQWTGSVFVGGYLADRP
jgi:hypothetical protein